MDDPVAGVAARLRLAADDLAILRDCTPADQTRFAELVEHAVRSQSAEIDSSLEKSLTFVPRLLRGRARSLLFPGGGRG